MFRNRQGQESDQRFEELEKTLGLENLVDTEVLTAFPAAGPQGTSFHIVDDSGTFYLVILSKGARHRVSLTSF